MKKEKTSIILTTHDHSESEQLTQRSGIMVNGQFVTIGEVQYLKDKFGYGYDLEIKVKHILKPKYNEILNKLESKTGEKIEKILKDNLENVLINLFEDEKDKISIIKE